MIRTLCLAAAMMLTQQICLAEVASTATADSAAVLEAALRARYPQINRWQLAPTAAVQHKRRPKLFARIEGEVEIRRDGSTFSVYSGLSSRPSLYRVAGYRQVNAAAEYLPKNHMLQTDSIVSVERDVLSLGCDPLVSELGVSQWRVRHPVRADVVLCTQDVEARPLIVRNQAVTIRCDRGPVSAAVSGVALSDGMLGEFIQVRWDGRYRASRAAVVQPGEVNACI